MNEPEHNKPATDVEDAAEIEIQDVDDEAAGDGEETSDPVSVEMLQERLAKAEAEARERADEALRVRAEMENLRRRTQREIENARKFALERFMTDLLDVRDSLERGLEAAQGEQVSVEQLREGKELTFKMLEKVLGQHGLAVVDPEGERFDPELHEAISMVPSEDQEPDTVVTVVQKGFTLQGRLLRPARVIVAR